MKLQVLLYAMIFVSASCERNDLNLEDDSDCISAKIASFKASKNPCSSGKSILRYEFQGNVVYVFHPGDCIAGGGAQEFDENCNQVCFLGGIAGNTKCNNQEFSSNATNERLIWEN